ELSPFAGRPLRDSGRVPRPRRHRRGTGIPQRCHRPHGTFLVSRGSAGRVRVGQLVTSFKVELNPSLSTSPYSRYVKYKFLITCSSGDAPDSAREGGGDGLADRRSTLGPFRWTDSSLPQDPSDAPGDFSAGDSERQRQALRTDPG